MSKMKFTDCIDIVGSTPSEFIGSKIYVSTGALECEHINYAQTENITYNDRPSRANLSVNIGDILFAKMQGTKKSIIIDTDTANHIYSTGFVAVHAKDDIISKECLYYLVTSECFLNRKDKNCTGATQKAITNAGLDKIYINIPEKIVQNRIVNKLDKITYLINICNTILEKLDLLIKAKFLEMFGDPVYNPMKWKLFQIGKRCEIVTGNTPSRADTDNYVNFIEWIKSDNINTPDTFLTQAEEYLSEKGEKIGRCVDSGSVLMTCIAGSLSCIGNVGVADRRVAFNQQINAIVPKTDETMYIYWLMILSKSCIQSTINMALKGILSKGKLSIMEFPFPPFELQKQFSDFVEQTEKSKSTVKQVLEKAEMLKKALMQEYFG